MERPERIFSLDERLLGTDARNSAIFVAKSAQTEYKKLATRD